MRKQSANCPTRIVAVFPQYGVFGTTDSCDLSISYRLVVNRQCAHTWTNTRLSGQLTPFARLLPGAQIRCGFSAAKPSTQRPSLEARDSVAQSAIAETGLPASHQP